MSDLALRDLQRLSSADPSDDALAARVIRERLRLGLLDRGWASHAAALGHRAAALALGLDPPYRPARQCVVAVGHLICDPVLVRALAVAVESTIPDVDGTPAVKRRRAVGVARCWSDRLLNDEGALESAIHAATSFFGEEYDHPSRSLLTAVLAAHRGSYEACDWAIRCLAHCEEERGASPRLAAAAFLAEEALR